MGAEMVGTYAVRHKITHRKKENKTNKSKKGAKT